jgi:glycosyltransferase involved in cell wall biosynthesis
MSVDVSIIIPTYNRLWSLPRAIESCLSNQCSIEIIVIDDASTDGTTEWLKNQKNITSIIQPYNLGQTWGINQAAQIAQGRYIKKLDSDDFIPNGIIDKQLEIAEQNQSDIVISRSDLYYENQKKIIQCPDAGPWEDFLEIQLGIEYGSHINAMLFKKEIFQIIPHRPDYSYRDDRLVLLEMALLQPKISYLNICGHYWVQHSTQMQANYAGMLSVVANFQHLKIFKLITEELKKRNQLTPGRAKAVSESLWRLSNLIAITHLEEAKSTVDYLKQINPEFQIQLKGIKGLLLKFFGYKGMNRILYIYRMTKIMIK